VCECGLADSHVGRDVDRLIAKIIRTSRLMNVWGTYLKIKAPSFNLKCCRVCFVAYNVA
jgi:hypothetical protein